MTGMAVFVALVLVVIAPAAGFAQASAQETAQGPVQGPAQAPAPASGADRRPVPRGLFGDLNTLFDAPVPTWTPPPLKSPAEAIEDFNARARDAGESLSRLRSGTVATGRTRCPVAANGAPDCQAAADRMCRDKGFKDGRSVDVEAAEVCSARALLTRRTDEPGACHMENYVTRAACQ
jgi:hypothetical protein